MDKNVKQEELKKEEYSDYVKQVTPTHNLWMQMGKAFLVGGLICVLGQAITNYFLGTGVDKEMAGSWCSLILVFLAVLLTGLNIYPKIADRKSVV